MTATLDFIIPAYNAEATLGDTLRSLMAQTSEAWRAIVIDDGSTDGTIATAVAAGADRRIRIVGQVNAGVAAARNHGFALTHADPAPLVCFLDADDVIASTFVERMSSAIGGSDLVTCAYAHAGPGLESTGWTATPGPDDHRPQRLAEANPFCMGAMVFRRGVLERAGPGGPVFGGVTRLEDWELYLELNTRGARWAPVVDEVLFTYRLRPGSRGSDLRTIWRDGLSIIDRYHPVRGKLGPALRRWTLRNLARAAAAEDRGLASEMLSWLTGLQAADEGVLAGALRSAIRREVISTGRASSAGIPGLAALLGGGSTAVQAAARAVHAGSYWSLVAKAAAARMSPGQTLVLYGMGRNGQELAHQLRKHAVVTAYIDDAPPVAIDIPRLRVDQLGPQHRVIVTPDDRGMVLRKLAGTRAGAIWLPEQLAAPSLEGCAA